jgi:hypothetical protein
MWLYQSLFLATSIQNIHEKPVMRKFNVACFKWFKLYLMQNFEENLNMTVSGSDSACVTLHTKNGDWDTG